MSTDLKTCSMNMTAQIACPEKTRDEILRMHKDHMTGVHSTCCVPQNKHPDKQIIRFVIDRIWSCPSPFDAVTFVANTEATRQLFTGDGPLAERIGKKPFCALHCAAFMMLASDVLDGEQDFSKKLLTRHTYPFLLFKHFDDPDLHFETDLDSNSTRHAGLSMEEKAACFNPLRAESCHDPEAVADQVFADLELDRDSVRNITLTLSSRVIRACGEIDCRTT